MGYEVRFFQNSEIKKMKERRNEAMEETQTPRDEYGMSDVSLIIIIRTGGPKRTRAHV